MSAFALKQPSGRRQAKPFLRLALLSLLSGLALLGTPSPPAIAGDFPLRMLRLDRAEPESAQQIRPWISPPLIRIDVSNGEEFDFDNARLRNIDADPSRPSANASAREFPRQGGLTELFRSSQLRSWIHGRDVKSAESTLFALSDNDRVALLPVRQISFPNPLNMLGNLSRLPNPLNLLGQLPRLPNPLKLLGNPLRWGGRFRAVAGDNFNNLTQFGGNLIVDSGLPVGFDTEFNYRQDDARDHRLKNFWTGDFNVVYRFGKIRNAEIRAGIGVNWLSADSMEYGFNSTYGLDIYLAKPWIISTSFDWGTLGSDSLLHVRATAGLDFGRFEIFAGYDFFEIGSRERKTLIAGLGMWF